MADTIPKRSTVVTGNAPKTPPKSSPTFPPRKQAVLELIGVPLVPLSAMAAYQQRNAPDSVSPYALDVATIGMNSEAMADAIVGIADNYPVLGAALDKFAITTPFMALVAVGMTVAAQIAENHGKLPDGMRAGIPGVIDRQELAEHLVNEARQKVGAANGNGTAS